MRKQKRNRTLKKRYGENAKRFLWEKSRKKLKELYGENFYNLITKKSIEAKLKKYGTLWPTISCISKAEKEVVSFIKSIYQGNVKENNYNVLRNKELDIYIPEKNFAIEYDSWFWHSEAVLLKHLSFECILEHEKTFSQRHLQKTLMCEERNIRLLHILDLDWNNPLKQNILKSMIASALSIYTKKYFARKLKFTEVDSKTARKFLNENHLQGAVGASKYFALVDSQNNLIQVMSFQLHSNHKHCECELNRMATLLNTQVVGGFSKLLKNALKALNITTCTSYIDRSIFNGKGYKAVGFKKVSEIPPCYYYILDNTIKRREFGMRKNIERLYNAGILSYWNPEETERINMLKNKIPRIWDCGKIKVKYELD